MDVFLKYRFIVLLLSFAMHELYKQFWLSKTLQPIDIFLGISVFDGHVGNIGECNHVKYIAVTSSF